MGFIKGVISVLDFEKVESKEKDLIQLQGLEEKTKRRTNIGRNPPNSNLEKEMDEIEKRIATGLAISVVCNFCDGPIHGKPRILKFADIEQFFCCTSCKSGYSEKYRGRIKSIKRKYEGKSDIDE